MKVIKFQKSQYLSEFALSERCMRLLLIKRPDTFFKLRKNNKFTNETHHLFKNAFDFMFSLFMCEHLFVYLTANRLWLISAASMRLCLPGSLVSDARSLPARSTNHILQAHTQTRTHTLLHSLLTCISELHLLNPSQVLGKDKNLCIQ